MKKITLTLLLAYLQIAIIFAQTDDEKSAFQLSFFPPLSTQGMKAPEYTNAVSFNILAGVSKNVTKFSFSGLGMYVKEDLNGFHLSGLGTIAGNNGSGIMISGLLNKTSDFQGLQFSGLANMSNQTDGIQIGGLGNIAMGDMNGFQFSGLMNKAKYANGIQIGGLMNLSDELNGFQFSGLINRAKNVNGFQIAGLVNAAREVNGFQIGGLVNIAKNVNGFQFGTLLNIADDNDYPFGLVNIIKNGGEMSLGVTYNEVGTTMLSFRSGGRILYGIVGIGFCHELSDNKFMTEAGFGAHIPISSRFRINNELKGNMVTFTSKETTSHYSFSIMPAFKIMPKWEVFAGPSIVFLETDNLDNKGMFPNNNIWKKFEDDKLQQLYIGFSVGTHFIF